MKRLPDWRMRLEICMAATAAAPFDPGSVDCSLASADAVLAMTGVDLAADFRGRYTTLKGGFKKLRKAGYADIATFMAAHLDEIPVAFGQIGDIAVINTPEGPALGVVQGSRIYVRNRERLATLSLLQASRMFRL